MGGFQTTRWSLILAAREPSPDARAALEALCRAYRPAVLAYVRGHGHTGPDAEDLTQSFFARFLEKRVHASADPARGRFRVFMRTALSNFLANSAEYEGAACRRAPRRPADIDPTDLPDRGAEASPERAFEREWALTLVRRAIERLRDETHASGKGELFARLNGFLLEPPGPDDYARVARELGTRANTIAVATHRLRQRLHELVRDELTVTVDDDADLDDEYAVTVGALGRRQAAGGA
jgi:RNA polymerase sigma-70 factor (ECF subfamily)